MTARYYFQKAQTIAQDIRKRDIDDTRTSTNFCETFSKKETLKYHEVVQKYGLYKYKYEKDDINVAVLTGDIYIAGNLTGKWIINQVKELGLNGYMTLIDGNVIIDGDLLDDGNFGFLLIKGNLKCDYIFSENGHIDVYGDAEIKYAIAGEYNDGHIEIFGKTNVPYVITNDHMVSIIPKNETITVEHICNERENIWLEIYGGQYHLMDAVRI